MVSVSLDGLFAPALENGLERADLDRILPEIEEAHRALMARRGRDVGFYDVGGEAELIKSLLTEAKRLRSLSSDLLVLGIGGSSLGGQALAHALGAGTDYDVSLHFLDNVDPDTMADRLARLDPARTAAVVITKSGGTVETLAQLLIVRRWFRASVGQGETKQRLVFVTDPHKGLLRELAASEGIRAFEVPPNVGGRFSALTPVGLLPAAYLGIDIEELVAGAAAMAERVTGAPGVDNPAVALAAGALLTHRQRDASSIVMMPYADSLRLISNWFVQLWAESLGKRVDVAGKVVRSGQTPIPAVGATDQHAQLQLFVEGPRDKVVVIVSTRTFRRQLPIPDELKDREEVTFLHGRDLSELLAAERRATRAALLTAGVPVIDIELPQVNPTSVGGLLMLLEAACALTGVAMRIDPFDQPGVEAGKRMALGLLGRAGYEADAESVRRREALSS